MKNISFISYKVIESPFQLITNALQEVAHGNLIGEFHLN